MAEKSIGDRIDQIREMSPEALILSIKKWRDMLKKELINKVINEDSGREPNKTTSSNIKQLTKELELLLKIVEKVDQDNKSEFLFIMRDEVTASLNINQQPIPDESGIPQDLTEEQVKAIHIEYSNLVKNHFIKSFINKHEKPSPKEAF